MIPIMIPSKNRADVDRNKTLRCIFQSFPEGADINDVILVVEPQDEAAYRATFPQIKNYLILPENNQGIAYVRQFILQETARRGIEWYWMLDDDIEHCGSFFVDDEGFASRGEPHYNKKGGIREWRLKLYDELRICEKEMIAVPNLGQGCLEYRPMSYFAFANGDRWGKGTYADVAVLCNSKRLLEKGCTYRRSLGLKEDRDFTAQVLSVGLETRRYRALFFSVPKNGTNVGGLHDIYAVDGKEVASCKQCIEIWGENAKLQEKFRRKQLSVAAKVSKYKEEGMTPDEAKLKATQEFDDDNKGEILERIDVKFNWGKIRKMNLPMSTAFAERSNYQFNL